MNSKISQEVPDTDTAKITFSRSYQWRAILLLMVIYTFSYLDKFIMNILAESIKEDLQLQDWHIGLLTGLAFSLCYSIGGVPIARYADRGNRPKIITIAISVWSTATAMSGMVQNFVQMFIARMFVGIGEAGCSPAAHSLISDYVPKENRAFAISVYCLAIPIGTILGMGFGGIIADSVGWRWTFVIFGVPGVALALGAFFFLREPRNEVKSVAVNGSEESMIQALFRLWRIQTFRWAFVGVAVVSIAGYGVVAFQASFFLRTHQVILEQIATSLGMGPLSLLGLILGFGTGIAGLFGTLLGGYFADLWRQKGDGSGLLLLPAIAFSITGLLLLTSLIVESFFISAAFISVAFLFYSFRAGAVVAAIHSVVPASSRATASALNLMAASLIGLSLGPFFVGLFSDFYNYGLGLGSSEGLRWALITNVMFFFVSSPIFWYASSHLKNDVIE